MRFIAICLAFVLAFGKVVYAEETIPLDRLIKEARKFKKEGKVFFNFESIDLKLLTYFISELTGKNIVIGDNLKGKVSLVFSEPVSVKEAWEIYTSILKSRNYTVIDRGSYVEIVSAVNSRNVVPPVSKDNLETDELITYVYKLKNADVKQLSTILMGLKSSKGKVFNYQPANIVIITDTASNVKNLKKVIQLVDSSEKNTVVKLFRLENATSSDVSQAINIVFSDLSKKGTPIKVFNIRSQNAVLVKAPETAIKDIEKVIKDIDIPVESTTYRSFKVVHLKHAKAKDLANVLNKLLNNISLVSINTPKTVKGQKKLITPTSSSSKDKPKVIAEETTNSLVVYANKLEFEAIKKLIEDLDKQKKQILITALITEVSQSALKEIGVRWQILSESGGAAFRGGLTTGGAFTTFGTSNFVVGGISNSTFSVDANGTLLLFPDLLFILSLLESGSGFNVISSPKILAMENMKAKINVSQVVPFAQGVKYDINGNPIINYDYQEVGLILEVTPQISGENVIMELHQEVNDIIGFETAQAGNLSYIVPKTSKRELDTTITVKNGKTVVLGGLISKKTVQTIEGVPVLSHIPVIGNLFKYRSESKDKTNLFVFITPYVIEKPEDLAKITTEHMKLVEKLQKLKKEEKKEKPKIENKKPQKDIFEEYRNYFQ